MPKCLQGDVLEQPDQLLIVFGRMGFNTMGATWVSFAKKHELAMSDPFQPGEAKPKMFAPGRYIATVAENTNHDGMSDTELTRVLDDLVVWAHENGIKSIATNGVADVDHGVGREADRASDDRRAQLLMNLAQRYENQFGLKITLINIDDVFVR